MARRKHTVVIPGERSDHPHCRDNGKTFILTEMPADQGERWCLKARMLIAEATGTPKAEPADEGEAAALANMGIDFNNLRIWRALSDPSLDEVWNFIHYQHKPGHPALPITTGENSPIEEIETRLLLRAEALKLNLGFSQAAERLSSASGQSTT
jgi:hypothetical protein